MGVMSGKIRLLELWLFALFISGFLMFLFDITHGRVCCFLNSGCSLRTAEVLFAALRVWQDVALWSVTVP